MSEPSLLTEWQQKTELLACYQEYAKKNGITVSQLHLLEAVCLHPGCTQKALCKYLQLPKQRINLMVRELTEKELISYAKNEIDGRSKLLDLTKAGRATMDAFLNAQHHTSDFAEMTDIHTHVLENGTVVTHTHGNSHEHTHSHQHTKAVLDRLARSIGHLEKVRQMVEAGVDCSEVLIQLSAVKAAINSTGKLILKDHIEHCVVDAIEHGDHKTVEELNKAIDQFIK